MTWVTKNGYLGHICNPSQEVIFDDFLEIFNLGHKCNPNRQICNPRVTQNVCFWVTYVTYEDFHNFYDMESGSQM